MKFYEQFLAYLKNEGIQLEDLELEDNEELNGVTFPFIMDDESILPIGLMFDKQERFIDIFITLDKPISEYQPVTEIYETINRLNMEYRGACFYLFENRIYVKGSLLIMENFDLDLLLITISNIIRAVNTEWRNIRKYTV